MPPHSWGSGGGEGRKRDGGPKGQSEGHSGLGQGNVVVSLQLPFSHQSVLKEYILPLNPRCSGGL